MPTPCSDECDDNQAANAELFDEIMRERGAADWVWGAIRAQEQDPAADAAQS